MQLNKSSLINLDYKIQLKIKPGQSNAIKKLLSLCVFYLCRWDVHKCRFVTSVAIRFNEPCISCTIFIYLFWLALYIRKKSWLDSSQQQQNELKEIIYKYNLRLLIMDTLISKDKCLVGLSVEWTKTNNIEIFEDHFNSYFEEGMNIWTGYFASLALHY